MPDNNSLPDLAPPPPQPSLMDKAVEKPAPKVYTDTKQLPKKPKFNFRFKWTPLNVIILAIVGFILIFAYVFS